ncbi:hypothetical protein KJ707_02495 [Patescibacteria group bacterium]|nr:hypothetical protein [Patescibacteria group bacterium]MBU1967236.1 hypothetical protein [Patescibacteria group bacterium]MBU2543406.1 hypothetical protein [Patescibacteria group bacterium]
MPDIFDASKDKVYKDKVRDFVKKRLSPLEAVDHYSEVMRREESSRNPFDSYAPKPLMVYSFDSQLDDECVLLLLRKHPITQVGKVLISIALLIMPMFFSYVDFYGALAWNFQTAIKLFWYLITAGYALESFLTWFYNVYIVTDERIIDIDFLSLIYRNFSAAKLDKIEDITAVNSGVIQSLFDFGTVQIQTAAERTEFEFEDVPYPTKVTQFLNEMLVEEEREKLEGRVK